MKRSRRIKRSTRVLIVAALLALVVAAAYTFTASNNVPLSYAGSGQGTVSGYSVSGITYTLGSGDTINQVAFTLNSSASTVNITFDGNNYACAIAGGVNVTCDTTVGTQATASGPTSLTVIAAQ